MGTKHLYIECCIVGIRAERGRGKKTSDKYSVDTLFVQLQYIQLYRHVIEDGPWQWDQWIEFFSTGLFFTFLSKAGRSWDNMICVIPAFLCLQITEYSDMMYADPQITIISDLHTEEILSSQNAPLPHLTVCGL